jgi:hypothetical protein
MGKASRRERGTKRADTQAAVQTDAVAGGEHVRQYYALDWCSARRRLCCPSASP